MVIVHAFRAHRTPVQCHPLLRHLGHDTSLMPAYAFVWIGSQTVPVQLSPRSAKAAVGPLRGWNEGSAQNRANLYAKPFASRWLGFAERLERAGQIGDDFGNGNQAVSFALHALFSHAPQTE